jgi:hypothetical protein
MRHFIFSLFAIGVAAVAAMTATTALLNTPVRHAPAVMTQNAQPQNAPAPSADSKPAPAESTPATPARPGTAAPDAKPAAGADTKQGADADDEADKDPYEGIAPEELPPDMQYSADSSVSFPTNI